MGYLTHVRSGSAPAATGSSRLDEAIQDMLRIVDGNGLVSVNASSFGKGGIETEEQLDSALDSLRETYTEKVAAGQKVLNSQRASSIALTNAHSDFPSSPLPPLPPVQILQEQTEERRGRTDRPGDSNWRISCLRNAPVAEV